MLSPEEWHPKYPGLKVKAVNEFNKLHPDYVNLNERTKMAEGKKARHSHLRNLLRASEKLREVKPKSATRTATAGTQDTEPSQIIGDHHSYNQIPYGQPYPFNPMTTHQHPGQQQPPDNTNRFSPSPY
ncbi:hypothetical protein MMC14_001516, partial [Varicellaria rhodocarpa]|nr:hypothetical protein [Varicellaria rhodocarpa]